ncbi:ribonucleoside hydrolase RihC [Paenibacillus chitinolyticus]|uniref:ribonucleoside hydrolase RihC n=1 Tax=Paenibacillus chitinolyticus TaxID=79263 RepID=UPI001C450237|nr:ribonucleoside hydrolase RihC [Paenibacillus chitinolyticus]MBV6713373.1 ribonucleoside hydrolase RihC [Paenibacillus chitinolyticus]
MSVRKTPIIIDTDPGIDDAVAIGVALHHESLDVKLLTTVAGNVSVDKTTQNALKLIEFFGTGTPVARGAKQPLCMPYEDSSHIHGESGMGGYEFPEPTTNIHAEHAVHAIRETIMRSEEKITLVPIGPLTNIALFLAMYPELKPRIERIVLMGGSASAGNHTQTAEYNIYADPEAAKMVFASGLDITLVGLDVTRKATLTPDNVVKIRDLNETGNMLYSMFQHYRGGSLKTGLKMHDLCAIAYIVKPELFKTQKYFVDVENAGVYTVGTTIVDQNNRYNKEPNVNVCLDIDVDAFRTWAIECIAKAK